MFRSFRIGSLFGIPVKLDVTFLLILPIFAWTIAVQIADLVPMLNGVLGTEIRAGPLTTGSTPWILGTAAAIGLFASVLLHELGHSLVAIRYGFPHRFDYTVAARRCRTAYRPADELATRASDRNRRPHR
jgi:Zn-dependent protease